MPVPRPRVRGEMIAFIPDQAVPVVTGFTAWPGQTALHAVLLITLLVLVFEKLVITAVQGDTFRAASGTFTVGLVGLGIAAGIIVAQAVG
jgi:hypothetical protein